jgi:hypothetical protein
MNNAYANAPSLSDLVMDLMDKYDWMPASIARHVIEHNIDIEKYV